MTLIPDLERDLVEAARRTRAPRWRMRAARRAALVALTATALGGVLVVWRSDDSDSTGAQGRPARSNPDATSGHDDLPAGTPPPKPDTRPLAGTTSKPVVFSFEGIGYRMVGFRSRDGSVCVRLERRNPRFRIYRPAAVTCAGERFLMRQLKITSVLNVGGGGGMHYSVAGFASAQTARVAVTGTGQPSRVVLSDPWRPGRWRGKPIRAFDAVIAQPPGGGALPRADVRGIRVVPAR